jgi:hypothetical protein
MRYGRPAHVTVAIASLAVAAVLIVLGLGLVPARAIAEQRDIVAQWLFAWGLIWLTALTAAVLSVFLLLRAYASE